MQKFIAFILLTPFISFSQPKGVNAIIVHGISLSLITDSLKMKGIEVDKIQGDSIITKPIQYYSKENDIKRNHANLIMKIKFESSSIFITGIYTYDQLETKIYGPHMHTGKWTIVENGYTKGSYMRRAFDYINEFAKSLHVDISYLKQ